MKLLNVKKFSKVIFGIFTGLICFDIGLRIIENTSLWRIFPLIEPILGVPDKNIGYKFTPNLEGVWVKENRVKIKINSFGFRDSEYSDDFNNDFRIALTGDSIVEGLQVSGDYVFENISERNLKKIYQKDIRIFNLSKSGDGPLRQLATLEEIGYDLIPDLAIFFSSYVDFLSGELMDDSVAPGYSIGKETNLERSYSFRKRWQVEYSDSRILKYLLGLIQESPLLRMFYNKSKEDFKDFVGINKENVSNISVKKDICFKDDILKIYDFLNKNSEDFNFLVFNYFLRDLNASVSKKNIPIIYIVNSIPIPASTCQNELLMRKIIIDDLKSIFDKNEIFFVDFNYLIYKKIGKSSSSKLKYKQGHLNYLGHQIYSDVFTSVIREYLDKTI